MGGITAGLNMGQEALDHLRHLRGPHSRVLTVPLAGTLPASLLMEEPVAVPLGWEWKLTRWSFTADGAGPVTCLMYVGTQDRQNLVEVGAGAAPITGFSPFADAVGNNAILRAGERLIFQFAGATVGGLVTVRLQVEASQAGTPPKVVDDFQREDYEDAPEEEHTEHPVGVGGEVTPHSVQTPHPLAFLGIGRDRL